MKKTFYMLMGTVGVLLASCSSLQMISFDQLQAGEASFPAQVRRVAVVNNMPDVEVEGQSDEIRPELEGDGRLAAETLAERLADVNYFEQVIICDSAFRAADEVPRVNVLWTKDEVKRLTDELGADMLISFDRIHIRPRPGVILYPDIPVPINAVDAVVAPVVRMYIPGRDKPLLVFARQDTISWELGPMFSNRKIVREASEFAASLPVDYLLPHWAEVSRFYYEGGGVEMRDAGVSLREHDWDGAYELWSRVYEKKKGRAQRMRAAYNIALYFDITGDAEQAIGWLDRARQLAKPGTSEEALLDYYARELEARKETLSRLHMQMQRFGDNF